MTFEMKEAITAGLIGGLIAAVICMALNQYVVPFPQTPLDNTIGHGLSGLFSGLLSGFIGVFIALKKVGGVRH